jgi:hypothetical protein
MMKSKVKLYVYLPSDNKLLEAVANKNECFIIVYNFLNVCLIIHCNLHISVGGGACHENRHIVVVFFMSN